MATRQIRPIRVEGNIAYVPLTQGYEAIIDALDVPKVEGFNWTADVQRKRDGSIKTVYGFRRFRRGVGMKQGRLAMHRVIAGTEDGMETDHIDGDGLNNRRKNLRSATGSQNRRNARLSIRNASGAKGVSWLKSHKKWEARIMSNGKKLRLGLFASVDDAAAAYCKASAELHGEFGRVA